MKIQRGYITKKSGSWLGHYSRWVLDGATGVKRRVQRAEVLGPVSGMTKTKAKEELSKVIVRELGVTGDSRMTVAGFITQRWQPLREGTWRPSTKTTNEELLRVIEGRFGTTALEDIDSVALQTWLNEIAKKRSGSAVKHCRIFLRSIFSEATETKYLTSNPARSLKVPKLRPVLRLYLDMAEVQALLRASMPFGMVARDTCLLRLLLTTGLRPSELFALRWRSVDLEQGTLSILETVYRGEIRPFGKTTEQGEIARLALPPEAVSALQRQWEIAQDSEYGGDNDFIFPTSTGTFWLKENWQRRILSPLVKQAKIKKVVNYQVLRRTCMTHMMQFGTLKDVQTVARHKRGQTTMDNYIQGIEESIHVALGIDKMFEHEREYNEKITIPAGMIRMSNGTKVRVYLDRRYVLGPEGAHVNIAGISGLATKTSYAMFLIQSIMQTVGEKDVAVILLNVKQNDLLVIDKPRKNMKPEEHELWEYLGLRPQPFTSVRYLLPWGKETQTTGIPNCFGEPPDQFQTYAYSLRDVIGDGGNPGPGLSLMVRVPDPWDTLGALIGEIQQGIGNNEPKWQGVNTWSDLLNKKPLMDQGIPQKFGEVAASSVGRFVRVLRRVTKNRQSGVFVEQRSPRKAVNLGEEIRKIQGGQTTVVDIAKLTDEERALVFGQIIREVYGMYAEASLDEKADLPKKVVIFVDELNKYAPARRGESESSILEYVLDIAARGRSLGVVLISAEQFMSEVHGQVVGNSSTKVIGRSDSAELSDASYRFISNELKAHLTRLDKGELLLSHPIYRQPVKIEFPRPAYQAIGHER